MAEDTGKTHQRNFVFGYGSLICPESRKETNPTLANQDALPVMVQNVERVWSARTQMYTAMGVQFRRGAECTGVLLEVNAMELKDLDEREKLYDRCSLELQTIQQVSFLEQELFYSDKEHPVFVAKANNNNINNNTNTNSVQVWIYVQQNPLLADSKHPIVQSYVDIIMKGCLRISKEFATSFIETTTGWEGGQQCQEEDTKKHVTTKHWIDDRKNPLYVRADPDFSFRNGSEIDVLLKYYQPVAFNNRIIYHHNVVVGNRDNLLLLRSKAVKERTKSKRKKKKRLGPLRNIIFEYNDSVSSSPERSRDHHQDYHPSVLDQKDEEGLHVSVRNVKLITGTRTTTTITTNNGKTPMIGVCFQKGSTCPGKLLQVSPEELKEVDKWKESLYNRYPLHLDNITIQPTNQQTSLPFMHRHDHNNNNYKDHPVFQAKSKKNKDDDDNDDVQVWIYVPKDPILFNNNNSNNNSNNNNNNNS